MWVVCVCVCVGVCGCVGVCTHTLMLGTLLSAPANVSTGQSTADSNSASDGKNSIQLHTHRASKYTELSTQGNYLFSRQRCSLKQGTHPMVSWLYRDR